MDNNSIDKLTKEILKDSRIELNNPDFNSLLMNKIKSENRKQSVIHNVVLYFLIFIMIDASILALLKLFNLSLGDITVKTISLLHEGLHDFSVVKSFLFINFLAIVFLAINIGSQKKFRVHQH